MADEEKQRRVVLIFGEPNSGKSYLADRLGRDYEVVRLDEAYVDFVESEYSDFNIANLDRQIKWHYQFLGFLSRNGAPALSRYLVAWRDRVMSLIDAAFRENYLVAVEGYELLYLLTEIQEMLSHRALVKTVEVRNHQYFIASSIDQFLPGDDSA